MRNTTKLTAQLESVMYHIVNNGETSNSNALLLAEFNSLCLLTGLPKELVVDIVKGEIIKELVMHDEVYVQFVDVTETPNYKLEFIKDFTEIFLEAIK